MCRKSTEQDPIAGVIHLQLEKKARKGGDGGRRERDLLVGWGVYKWPEGWPLMVVGIGTQITSRLGFEDKGRLYRDQLYSQRGSFSQNTRQRRENDSNPEWPESPAAR